MKKIGIIGGGIIGLCTAYYLSKKGYQVVVFEQSKLEDGCSWGNAGMIVPSHIIPLASPGVIAKGMRWMLSAKSPFYIRPRFNTKLIRWSYLFYKHATHRHVQHAIPVLKEISLYSKALYKEIIQDLPFNIGYKEHGLLMLFQTKEIEHEEIEMARLANTYGIEAHVVSPAEIQKMEPEVCVKVRGGIYFPGDAHLTPQDLVTSFALYLQQNKVIVRTDCKVTDLSVKNNKIQSIVTQGVEFPVDEVIVSAGAWSGMLSSRLGISLPMQSGKGYSFTLDNIGQNIHVPSILVEPRVAATPMGNTLRFGGTMEIAGIDPSINMKRVEYMVNSIADFYPDLSVSMPLQENVWYGFRPCSPDGLPYIGRHNQVKNLLIASGHSMMGVTLAPATGKIISSIVSNEPLEFPIDAFSPERFDK